MSVSRSFSSGVQMRDLQWKRPFWFGFMPKRQEWICLFAYLLMSSTLLVSCSWLNFGGGPGATATARPTPSGAALANLHWCGKALMIFRDEGVPGTVTPAASTPTTAATVTATSAVQATPSIGTTPTAM